MAFFLSGLESRGAMIRVSAAFDQSAPIFGDA
jgi:hypothetical protein